MSTKFRTATTSDATFEAIAKHGPVNTQKLSELLGVPMARLSASMSNWYRDAKGDWAHVHRERDDSSTTLSYVYRFSSELSPRKPQPKKSRSTRDGLVSARELQTTRVPVRAPEPKQQSSHVDKLAALVLWDVDDDVILLDADGGLIRGRRVQ